MLVCVVVCCCLLSPGGPKILLWEALLKGLDDLCPRAWSLFYYCFIALNESCIYLFFLLVMN